jgi:hypothetical protein
MASLVNPSNINGNFPIAGQDNDSQGFRDNFTNIRNNFTFIKQEVEDLQSKAVLKSALTGGALDNNFLGSQLKNTQLKNYAETMYDWGNTSGEIQLDLALGNVHKVYSDASISVNSVIKNWPSSLQYARVLLYITISNTAHTLTIPNNITTTLEAIPGLRVLTGDNVVTFSEASTYIYEFSSVDSGTTVFVRELTRGNHLFRDPNFYFTAIGAGTSNESGFDNTTLKINWGNVLSVSGNIDSAKSGTDALQIRGGVTSFMSVADGTINSANLRSAGFTVARSRIVTPSQGGSVTQASGETVDSGDLLGYFNGMALTKTAVGSDYVYQQLASMQFYANGTDAGSIGGNIVFATKPDLAASLQPAMIIDNKQSVTVVGNLTVLGNTVTVNAETLVVEDKNVVVAYNSGGGAAANGAGLSVDGVGAALEYYWAGISGFGDSNDRWAVNKAFTIPSSTIANSSTTGALVVGGGAGIGGDLFVGGSININSSTNATDQDSGAFVLANGGLGVQLNIVAGGGIFANTENESSTVSSGGLVTKGGLGVAKKAIIGGNVVIASEIDSTTTGTGALVVKGGLNVQKAIIANTGPVILGDTTDSSYDGVTFPTSYSGALRVYGGAHIAKTLRVGNEANQGKIIIHAQGSTLQGTIGDSSTGALVVGSVSGSDYAGVSVSGNFNLGYDTGGVLYIKNKNSSFGVPNGVTDAQTPTAYTALNDLYGAATILGGVNVMGNVFVGQPTAGGGVGSQAINSGNLYVQSGTRSISAGSGAIVIQKVALPAGAAGQAEYGDGFARGGLGMEGNLWATGNVVLGGSSDLLGSGDAFSNVTINGSRQATSTTAAALSVRGGVGIVSHLITGGNVFANATFPGLYSVSSPYGVGSLAAKQGALVIPTGGAYIEGTSVMNGNLVITSTASGATTNSTTTGALVIAGTNAGIGVAGGGSFGGDIKVFGTTAGGGGTGALTVSGQGAGGYIAGNLFIGGQSSAGTAGPQPINAVGASGVAIVSSAGTAYTTTTVQAGGQDIAGLNFFAEAGKIYAIEALVYHNTSTTNTKGFGFTFSSGTLSAVVEQNTGATSALSTVTYLTATATGATVAAGGAATGMLARISGTFTSASAVKFQLQAYLTATAGTLTVLPYSYLKWTRLT